ncbi:MAG: acyltransferase family protein [Bacteroidota bacterium]
MNPKTTRLFFIDAIRAWAILMMLQGHFIDGLLDPFFRNTGNTVYTIWLYFRGITAPVFFTVSGFIFTYLLIRVPQKGFQNPRIKKGVRRGLQLLLIGYLLRMNLFGLLKGEIYSGFYLVDVLHCIGLSILVIIGVYLFAAEKRKYVFPLILASITLLLFLFEPIYKQWSFGFLPTALANYFTKANGSVFTIIPWLGYTALGGFLSILFTRFKNYKYLYPVAISIMLMAGFTLIYYSSLGFFNLHRITGIELFSLIEQNNYLFIRLGDVFVVFAIFMVFRKFLTHSTVLKIGQNTLSIYVIHFIILYGSFTGLGLYKFFHHSLPPVTAIIGALLFMFSCTFFALQYGKYEADIKLTINTSVLYLQRQGLLLQKITTPYVKSFMIKARLFLNRIFATVKIK